MIIKTSPGEIDLSQVHTEMFVAFYTGYADRVEYGTKQYFKAHAQLSFERIDALLEKIYPSSG